jgi:uncharacterized membrane protein YedE/YeeE
MKTKEWISTIFQYVLAVVIVAGVFYTLNIFGKNVIPTENKDMVNQIIGGLMLAFGMVVGYFFGSSVGSSKKTDALVKNADKVQEP